jgi:DNA-binding transcriptional LysR family regulator
LGGTPLLEIQIITAPQTDALQLLHTGSAQLALVFERPAADGRENFQEVGREALVAVIARTHPLLAEIPSTGTINDSQLRPVRQVMVGSRSPAERTSTTANFCIASEHYWRVDQPEVALQLVLAELGWAWLPRACVQPYLNGRMLVELPIENFTNGEELWIDLVWSRERPLGLGAQRVVELMAERYRNSR